MTALTLSLHIAFVCACINASCLPRYNCRWFAKRRQSFNLLLILQFCACFGDWFFPGFSIWGCNRITGGAGQTGTHWRSGVRGCYESAWGLTTPIRGLKQSLFCGTPAIPAAAEVELADATSENNVSSWKGWPHLWCLSHMVKELFAFSYG
jgi:hypothetical protein